MINNERDLPLGHTSRMDKAHTLQMKERDSLDSWCLEDKLAPPVSLLGNSAREGMGIRFHYQGSE